MLRTSWCSWRRISPPQNCWPCPGQINLEITVKIDVNIWVQSVTLLMYVNTKICYLITVVVVDKRWLKQASGSDLTTRFPILQSVQGCAHTEDKDTHVTSFTPPPHFTFLAKDLRDLFPCISLGSIGLQWCCYVNTSPNIPLCRRTLGLNPRLIKYLP